MRPLVLIAAPGAGSVNDRDGFDDFERELREGIDNVDVGWIYTSERLLVRARHAGSSALSASEGIALLGKHGGPAVILSLHLVNGREYRHVSEPFRARDFKGILLTSPLLESEQAARELIQALIEENPIEADEVRVLVTHGSPEPDGIQALSTFTHLAEETDPRTTLGVFLGSPGFRKVAGFCCSLGSRRVCLVPMLLTTGPSTQSLANHDDEALAPFRAVGIATRSTPRGLLSIPRIRRLWLNQLQQMLQRI